MTYNPIPKLSSNSFSRASTPCASASPERPLIQSKSTMSSIKKAVAHNIEDYWSQPSPLFTPPASVDASRNTSTINSRTVSVSSGAAATAAPAAATKPEKKGGLINKVKRAVNRSTEEYWGNPEMNAYYGGRSQT